MALLLTAAAVIGVVVGIRRRPRVPQQVTAYRDLAKRATVAVTAAAVLVGVWSGGGWVTEQDWELDYLQAFERSSFQTISDDVLLGAGHRACDWLQDRPWGTPAEGPELISYLQYGDVKWTYAPPTNSNSTDRLEVSYASTVASPDPYISPADDELLLILAAEPAWHELCPSSQWIRRPAGPFNGGGDGGGD